MHAVSFDSRNVSEFEAFASSIYSRLRLGAVGSDTRARITRRLLTPQIGFDDLACSFDIGYSGEPPDLLIICDVVSNTIRVDGHGAQDTFGPGDQLVLGRPTVPYIGVAHCSTLRFTVVDPCVLDTVAVTARDDKTGRVRLLDHRPISRQAQRQLQRATAYVRDAVPSAPDSQAPSLIASTAGQYLAAQVLHTFASTALLDPTHADRRDAHPSTLRRAIAFIESNPARDLTVADIAEAAYVTPRALQLAFRNHLDTTPVGYLRRVRLAHAREDLRNATPGDGQTVKAIAAHWGFTSTRFTQQYRATYDESPSQTLRAAHLR